MSSDPDYLDNTQNIRWSKVWFLGRWEIELTLWKKGNSVFYLHFPNYYGICWHLHYFTFSILR